MKERHILSTWKKVKVPRGKNHNKTETKTTVSLYLSKSLVEQAKIHKLSLSRVTEQALLSIIDYMAVQKINSSSDFSLSTGSLFPKEKLLVDGAGFEPAASTMPTWRSYQTDLPAQRGPPLKT